MLNALVGLAVLQSRAVLGPVCCGFLLGTSAAASAASPVLTAVFTAVLTAVLTDLSTRLLDDEHFFQNSTD